MSDLLQQVIESCSTQYEECMSASTSASSSAAAKQKARQRALEMEKQAVAAQWYLTDAAAADTADSTSSSGSSGISSSAAAARPRCAFVDALVSIQWVPVLTQLPKAALPRLQDESSVLVGLRNTSAGASDRNGELAVCSPKHCRPKPDMWMCSAKCAVSTVPVTVVVYC
jgi:hypothetical protein